MQAAWILALALVGSLAIVLTAVAAALVLLREDVPLAGASLGTLLILVAYLVGTRAVFQESERQPAEGTTPRVRRALLRRTAVRFALAAGAILVAAPLFARAAKELAEITGLGPTFLGTALLGLATSAPELVTSFAAVRLGSVALAVGNLFGSNAFNMAILPVLDVVQPGAPLLATAHPAHALSGLFGVVSMGIAMAALFHRAERRYAFAIPASILLFANHALALWLVLARSAPP